MSIYDHCSKETILEYLDYLISKENEVLRTGKPSTQKNPFVLMTTSDIKTSLIAIFQEPEDKIEELEQDLGYSQEEVEVLENKEVEWKQEKKALQGVIDGLKKEIKGLKKEKPS